MLVQRFECGQGVLQGRALAVQDQLDPTPDDQGLVEKKWILIFGTCGKLKVPRGKAHLLARDELLPVRHDVRLLERPVQALQRPLPLAAADVGLGAVAQQVGGDLQWREEGGGRGDFANKLAST